MSNGFRWCVQEKNTGLPLANGYAPSQSEAVQEMTHYATQYAQDEPVDFWVRENRKTVLKGSMSLADSRTPTKER